MFALRLAIRHQPLLRSPFPTLSSSFFVVTPCESIFVPFLGQNLRSSSSSSSSSSLLTAGDSLSSIPSSGHPSRILSLSSLSNEYLVTLPPFSQRWNSTTSSSIDSSSSENNHDSTTTNNNNNDDTDSYYTSDEEYVHSSKQDLDEAFKNLDLQAPHLDNKKMCDLVALCLHHKDHRVDHLIKEMINRKMITPRLLGKVQAMYSQEGNVEKTKYYLHLFQRCKTVTVLTHNRVIHALVRSETEESAYAVLDYLDEMQEKGIEPDGASITTAMQAWAKRGRVDRVLMLWEKMKEKEVKPQEATFNTILSTFANQHGLNEGEAEQAKEIFLEMQRYGYHPCEISINMMVKILTRLKGAQIGENFLQEVTSSFGLSPQPTQPSNTIISAFIREGQYEKAAKMAKELRERGGGGDKATTHALLNACVRGGDLGGLVEMFKLVVGGGGEVEMYTWNTLLNGFANVGDVVTLEKIVEEMKKGGFEPDNTTYSTLLKAYLEVGDEEKAEELFKEAKRKAKVLDSTVFNVYIRTYVRNGEKEKVSEVLEEMQKREVPGDHITYHTLIRGCGGDVEGALKLFGEMEERGLSPVPFSVNSVLQSYVKAKDSLEGGMAFFDKYARGKRGRGEGEGKKVADTVTYNIMINMLRKGGEYEKALELFQEMKEEGYLPTIPTYNTMISVAEGVGDLGLAKKLFDEMKEQGLKPTLKTYSGLVRAARGRPQLAKSYYQEAIEEKGLKPDIVLFYSLLLGAFRARDLGRGGGLTGGYLSEEMERYGVKKDESYKALEYQYFEREKELDETGAVDYGKGRGKGKGRGRGRGGKFGGRGRGGEGGKKKSKSKK